MKFAARLPVALALASVFAFVLATRGFDAFDGVRLKVVTGTLPATSSDIRLAVDGRGTATHLKPPFAVIAKLGNGTAQPQTFTVEVDGQTICQPTLAGHATQVRADCVVTAVWAAGVTHTVVRGPAADWSLQYLELSSHHGASSGAWQIFVIPHDATPYSKPSTADVVVFWFAAFFLYLLPVPDRLPRVVRVIYLIAATAIGALLAGIILAPWVSRFSIVLSWATLARCAVVLALPAVWRLAAGVVTRLRDKRSEWARLGRPAAVAGLVLLAFGFVMTERLHGTYLGNYSGFIQIGEVFLNQSPYIAHQPDVRRTLVVEQGGYDGQFMYYAAYDPLIRAYHADPRAVRRALRHAAIPVRPDRLRLAHVAGIVRRLAPVPEDDGLARSGGHLRRRVRVQHRGA